MNISLYAPTRFMFAISVIFACIALLGASTGTVPFVSGNAVWILTFAFVILAVSCMVRMQESLPAHDAPQA